MQSWRRHHTAFLAIGFLMTVVTVVSWRGEGGTGVLRGETTPLPASRIAAKSHSLFLDANGGIYAWGRNTYGGLGIGTTANSAVPVKVKGLGGTGELSGIQEISAGDWHTLALANDGSVYAWGRNAWGTLGNGSSGNGATLNSLVPVKVKGLGGTGELSGIKAVSAGEFFSIALGNDGSVYAWGTERDNNYGELGIGSATTSSVPVKVKGLGGIGDLSGIKAVSAGGYHILALANDGSVYAWGRNGDGQLGNGTTSNSYVPVKVKGLGGTGELSGIKAIAAGNFFSLALANDGSVYTWGNNGWSSLGIGGTTNALLPVKVKGLGGTGELSGIQAISAGPSYFSLALANDGSVYGWGKNDGGQVGVVPGTDATYPVKVKGLGGTGELSGITAISAGGSCLALGSDGSVYSWGGGYLGDGTTAGRPFPAVVPAISPATSSSSSSHQVSLSFTFRAGENNLGTLYPYWGGGMQTYQAAFRNYGPDSMTTEDNLSFRLTPHLPGGIPASSFVSDHFTFDPVDFTPSCTAQGTQVSCPLPVIPVGAARGIQVSYKITPPNPCVEVTGEGGRGFRTDIELVDTNRGTVLASDYVETPLLCVYCGDGKVSLDVLHEGCDDGNTADGDGCSSTCQAEYGWQCSYRYLPDKVESFCWKCGDGIVVARPSGAEYGGEQCDDGNRTSGDGCNWECVREVCGDSIKNNNGTEQCDDGNTVAWDGCSPQCTIEPPPKLDVQVTGTPSGAPGSTFPMTFRLRNTGGKALNWKYRLYINQGGSIDFAANQPANCTRVADSYNTTIRLDCSFTLDTNAETSFPINFTISPSASCSAVRTYFMRYADSAGGPKIQKQRAGIISVTCPASSSSRSSVSSALSTPSFQTQVEGAPSGARGSPFSLNYRVRNLKASREQDVGFQVFLSHSGAVRLAETQPEGCTRYEDAMLNLFNVTCSLTLEANAQTAFPINFTVSPTAACSDSLTYYASYGRGGTGLPQVDPAAGTLSVVCTSSSSSVSSSVSSASSVSFSSSSIASSSSVLSSSASSVTAVVAVCGDRKMNTGETCDDGNVINGDGCSATCRTEDGWTCDINRALVCKPTCGDGLTLGSEQCDNANTQDGDGCSSLCAIEPGYACAGTPSICSRTCGNGQIDAGEQCDDRNSQGGDGCSAFCSAETGYACAGTPSVCARTCGNGTLNTGEECDDRNNTNNDGCDSSCHTEDGFTCTGTLSTCSPICGDGLLVGREQCDDGDATSGDGCSSTCRLEAGYACTDAPSVCTTTCGDGIVTLPAEKCDDKNVQPLDGCSDFCTVERGWLCSGTPSLCTPLCGDGVRVGDEQCDDGNLIDHDGCNHLCMTDAVISSSSEESSSVDITALASSSVVSANPLCGNGRLEGAEECEQGIRACPTGFTCDRFLCRCAALAASSARPVAASSAARSSFICGDRILDPGEDCESGIPCSAGASCSAACKCILRSSSSENYEEFFSFSSSSLYEPYASSPSFPFFPSYQSSFSSIGPSCGNGVLEEGEQCERNNSCGGGGICNLDCRCDILVTSSQPGSSAAVNLCGNGRVEEGEDCDDENISFMDGCLPSCRVEPGYACAGEPSNCFPICGDGISISPEECDDGNLSDGDGCSANCVSESYVPSAPSLPGEWIPPTSSLPASPEAVIAQPQSSSQSSLSSSSVGVAMPQEIPATATTPESEPSFFRRIYLFLLHLIGG